MSGTPAAAAPIVLLGETMGLVRAAEIGTFAHVHEARVGIGGAESNVAIGLARLGTPSVWLGRVGADSLGQRIVRELLAERVDVRAVDDDAAPTGLMLKESPTPRSTAVYYYRAGSAGSRLAPDDLDRVDLTAAALLHVTGITPALSDSAKETVAAAVARAHAAGTPVSFDVNHRSRLWRDESYREIYREIARHATIVFAGEDEAALLVDGREARELADNLADLGPRHVVIKRGADGASALDEGTWRDVAALAIDPVDTVGAGDAFVAGWLSEWHRGASPEERLLTAAGSGAYVCLHPGDWEGLPTRAQLAAFGAGADPVSR